MSISPAKHIFAIHSSGHFCQNELHQFLTLWALSIFAKVSSTHFCHGVYNISSTHFCHSEFHPFLSWRAPPIFATVSSTHFCHGVYNTSSTHFCQSEFHPFLSSIAPPPAPAAAMIWSIFTDHHPPHHPLSAQLGLEHIWSDYSNGGEEVARQSSWLWNINGNN